MKSQFVPISLYLIAAIIGAGGQYFYKIGANQIGSVSLFKNWPILLGMFLFCLVMVLFVIGFKLGGRLSVVYPFYATTFIWGFLIAAIIEKEPYSFWQILGVIVVTIGVAFIGGGSPK